MTISCPVWWKSERKSWPKRHWNLWMRCESSFLEKQTRRQSCFWTRYRFIWAQLTQDPWAQYSMQSKLIFLYITLHAWSSQYLHFFMTSFPLTQYDLLPKFCLAWRVFTWMLSAHDICRTALVSCILGMLAYYQHQGVDSPFPFGTEFAPNIWYQFWGWLPGFLLVSGSFTCDFNSKKIVIMQYKTCEIQCSRIYFLAFRVGVWLKSIASGSSDTW